MMHNSINNRWTWFTLITLLAIIVLSEFLPLPLAVAIALVIGSQATWGIHQLKQHLLISQQSEHNDNSDTKERHSHDQDR